MAYANDSLLLNRHRMGIVKSGVVYYKPARICLQPWPKGSCIKTYWCELHRESSYHPRQLVLLEVPTNTHEDVETIPLDNVFKIASQEGLVNGKSIFQIMTSNGKFTLGTDCLEETEKWINALHEELFGPPKHDVVYEFRVKMQKNHKEDAVYGNYLLKVYNKEIKLFTSNGLIPTKFKYLIKDIYKVKYQRLESQDSCVTISIKNIDTNNKEMDALILNTKSASEIAKVINYRKKNLDLQDDLDYWQPNFGELKQKFQEINITSDEEVEAASNPEAKEQKEACKDISVTSKSSESSKEKSIFQGSHSLPRMYNAKINPSIDDQDGEIWSESFNLRVPKRQHKIRSRKIPAKGPQKTISNRPPAVLPTTAEEISDEDDSNGYATIDSHIYAQLAWDSQSSVEYDYIKTKRSTFPKLKDANAVLTAMKSQDDDCDGGYVIDSIGFDHLYSRVVESENADCDDGGYVTINSIDSTNPYLQVLTPEEEDPYSFISDDLKEDFK